ncbi:hypothetical protein ACOJAI_12505 [Corynebacterium striatum]|uniref:hypothetical protein n=1 Tax=Corynebacterium striatum TaxID=43770 RepID=UPI003B59801A
MTYVLRIAHDTDSSPRWGKPFAQTIYRDVEFPDDATLSILHLAIIGAMRWANSHSDLSVHSREDLEITANIHNHKPRKILGWKPQPKPWPKPFGKQVALPRNQTQWCNDA